jgi:hypothetical protein
MRAKLGGGDIILQGWEESRERSLGASTALTSPRLNRPVMKGHYFLLQQTRMWE